MFQLKNQKGVKNKMATKKKVNPWLVHVKKVKVENPKMKFSDVLVKAKKSYTKIKK